MGRRYVIISDKLFFRIKNRCKLACGKLYLTQRQALARLGFVVTRASLLWGTDIELRRYFRIDLRQSGSLDRSQVISIRPQVPDESGQAFSMITSP